MFWAALNSMATISIGLRPQFFPQHIRGLSHVWGGEGGGDKTGIKKRQQHEPR